MKQFYLSFYKFTAFLTQPFLDLSMYKMMVNIAQFVKSSPLRALSVSLQYFVSMLKIQHFEDVHEVDWCRYFYLDKFIAF